MYSEITGSMLEAKYQVDLDAGTIKRLSPKTGNWLDASWKTWNGYRLVSFPLGDRKYLKIRAHYLIWVWATGRWPADNIEIDHKNGDRSDNRISNLREATVLQNRINRKIQSNNKIVLKWVTKFKNRYRAEIRLDGKRVYSSFHDTAEEAYRAASIVARKLFGDFFNPG